MQSYASAVQEQLSAPLPNPALQLLLALKGLYPIHQHVSVVEHGGSKFPVLQYLSAISIQYSFIKDETHSAYVYDSDLKYAAPRPIVGICTFDFEGVEFRVYEASWTRDHQTMRFLDYVFEGADDGMGRMLLTAAYQWANKLREEMWVFDSGQWVKSKDLYQAVQKTNWDDIVLDDSFREGLRRDTETFFSSKGIYESLGVSWKRVILLLGPPGNGKTESIKALLHEFDYAALYVKSINTQVGPEFGVRSVFEHARKHAPCILILEDLDSMITDGVRSFFLNELDGLARNEGILTIATTNHPELIDDAILNRPSRFDVKYDFALPSSELRVKFATKWLGKIRALNTGATFQKSDEELAVIIAERTDTWSFAFLKELFVSFLLRIAHDKSLGIKHVDSADDVILDQVSKLELQIIKVKEEVKGSGTTDAANQRNPARFFRSMRMALPVQAVEAHALNL